MKTLALMFVALLLLFAGARPAKAQCGWACMWNTNQCDSCHYFGDPCTGFGCLDCNLLCTTLSAMTPEQVSALKRKMALRAVLNPSHLNDAGAIIKLVTMHLTTLDPSPRRGPNGMRLPVGHPDIGMTFASEASKQPCKIPAAKTISRVILSRP